MSLFKSILDKLGIGKKSPAAGTAAAKPAAPAAAKPSAPAAARTGGFSSSAPAAAKPAAMDMVDVVSKLDGLAKANPEKLDWKVSIVDLLKLLGLDSSLAARKGLATELGCPANLMEDSAKMNTWLHKTVLQKIAENGGNIPASMF